ncbi:class I tRNA ligase family protein [Kitasatospora sp. NPDC059827]|uniref:class I tRNA ligase family protein n=1 Tax=Kitasatospora sp. NPDC059827 TaxID=3346964 RepID=UPI0036628BC2
MLLADKFRTPKSYLLVPPEATPNGPLHLGHIGGPFLWSDMISRHLRARGDLPLVITGSDVYESAVDVRAHAEGSDPAEIADRYGERMQRDLASFSIDVDAYISPHHDEWRSLFENEVASSVGRLMQRGAVLARSERVPYCESSGRWVVDAWLSGRCPACGTEMSTYFCGNCSRLVSPELLVDPRPLIDEGKLTWHEVSSLFLRLPEPARAADCFSRMGIHQSHQKTAMNFLEKKGALLRLSTPQEWGAPLPGRRPGPPQRLYSNAGIFMFARLAGAVHGTLSGTGVNAFDPNSGVTTITTLGIDNVIATLVGIVGLSFLHGDMKPYQRCLINHFYQLAGEKFSTSTRHAIWAGEIAAAPSIDVDAVRYHLAKKDLSDAPASFEVADFLTTAHTELADRLGSLIEKAWNRLPDRLPGSPGSLLAEFLELRFAEQSAALDSARISTTKAVSEFDRWCTEAAAMASSDADGAYWWLKGVALLAFPVMPNLASQIWQELGCAGEPRLATFLVPTLPRPSRNPPGFNRVKIEELRSCLPPTM